MTIEFVIAKYTEDISWTKELESIFHITIYDKSEDGTLPNIGREAHTYLHHIITNYEYLADITIFLQGNPFEHHHHFREGSSMMFVDDVLPNEEFLQMVKKYHYNKTEPFFSYGKVCETKGIAHEAYNFLFDHYRDKLYYNSGAQWIVKREDIVKRSYEFYKRIYDIFINDPSNPVINAWTMERLWPYIFISTNTEIKDADALAKED